MSGDDLSARVRHALDRRLIGGGAEVEDEQVFLGRGGWGLVGRVAGQFEVSGSPWAIQPQQGVPVFGARAWPGAGRSGPDRRPRTLRPWRGLGWGVRSAGDLRLAPGHPSSGPGIGGLAANAVCK